MLELLILLAVLLTLGYLRTSLVAAATAVVATTLLLLLMESPIWLMALSSILCAIFIFLAYRPMRIFWISAPIYKLFKKITPTLSKTEAEALHAGTSWWDAELFSGRPNWEKLLATPAPKLRTDEQAFLDGPVETLCGMLDDWQIQQQKDLPSEIWDFLKSQGFFSLLIEKKYGGLEFSALGNSAVVCKIASRNLTAAVTVMVPNSLGPAELLRDFGTQEQRDYYLPRLVSGEDIPCFALTSPTAGSDAASTSDCGIVCRGLWQGEEVLGLRLNWDKRYITLAPVATVLGLAFQTRDPDHLLGEEDDLGLSCALIPRDLEGIWIGHRHLPVGAAFLNGPIRGRDVFIPLSFIIGGRERIGQGWSMLMHSLAAGRAISLPALGTAGVKLSARYSGEYARIRKQFGIPIARFEGVEEVLARLAGEAYRLDAARLLTLCALELGEKPGVLSAVLKWYATEANRRCINDAMDIHGGKGIITGPNNYLASLYQALPIGITVEGANILTRSLIIFGQGAIRNHPYLQDEIALALAPSSLETVRAFDKTLFGHIGFVINNFIRSFVFGITFGSMIPSPVTGHCASYYRQITRLSTVFAFVADAIFLTLGGSFKFREKLSGRMADALSHLYLASAMLKQFKDCGSPPEDLPLLDWGMADSLYQIQSALIDVLDNFPIPALGHLIHRLVFPLGHPYKKPSDTIGHRAAQVLVEDGEARRRLCTGLYEAKVGGITSKLAQAFTATLACTDLERRIKKTLNQPLDIDNYHSLLAEALRQQVVNEEEAERLRELMGLVAEVIGVDDFAYDQ